MYLAYIITIAILVSSLWVVFDASKHKMGSVASDTPQPYKIGFGCLFIWFVCFPYYLFKRSNFIERAREHPQTEENSKGFKFAFYVFAVLTLVISTSQFMVGKLPACEAKETLLLVQQIAGDNYGSGYVFSNAAQRSYSSSDEVRICRVQWKNGNKSGILEYKVEWYSDAQKEFYVEFL
ncbi:hypothetical protein FHO66_13185 [Vibrio cholerae]|nr:hypothetical protein [Vibrio cholerae]EJL6590614.1 hypothetical protein [Vibrio cholerae]